MRTLLIAVSFALAAGAAHAVDLDDPRVMDWIRHNKPEHYAKIEEILATAKKVPAVDLPKYLPATVGAANVRTTPLLNTSLPAKARLAFTLDGTYYDVTIIPRFEPARAQPAR